MKLNYEIEMDAELYEDFRQVCEEINLDSEETLAHCIEEYIANLKEEVEQEE
jgi:hypothetical protein